MRRSKQPRDAINYGINLAAIPGRMPKQAILLPVIRLEVESATTEGTDQDGGQPVEGAHTLKPIFGGHKGPRASLTRWARICELNNRYFNPPDGNLSCWGSGRGRCRGSPM